MKKLCLIGLTTLSLLTGCGQESANKNIQPNESLVSEDAYNQILEAYRVPAIAGLIMQQGETLEEFAVGRRAIESPIEVEAIDRWHLGSITKSFTATLTAKLIELGYLNWHTTIGDVFHADEYPASLVLVTIEQLLSHSGGITADIIKVPGWESYFSSTTDIVEQRLSLATELLKLSSGNKVGKFSYSNGSFVIAGAMLERIMADSWENLLTNYLLEPLDIHDAQFGAPNDGFDYSQPYGHKSSNSGWQSISPVERYSDNPLAMGPAGTLSMSLTSLAKYAQEHVQGHHGKSGMLTQETFQKLHSEVGNLGYGHGWIIKGTQISHSGTNTMWYAHLGIDLSAELVAIAATNVGGDTGAGVTDNIIKVMLSRNIKQ